LNFDEWKNLLFEFCNNNKRCPTQTEQYKNNNIGKWLQHQKEKIIDKNNNVYIKLSENIYLKESLDKYLNKKLNFVK